MKRGFGSDNHSGISPEILDAIANANVGHALAYGDDEYTERTARLFKKYFGDDTETFFVFNGTGANVLCIDAMVGSFNSVICAETAHVNVDECGAPQHIVGCRLVTIPTPDGKLRPEMIKPLLHVFGFEHHSQPKAITITQSTELGTLYTLDEIKSLADFAHANGLYLHVDGARIANASVALGATFKEMTTDCGVDVLSFGGTKNGMMLGEACVFINPKLAEDFKYRRKQDLQLCSKMRFVAAQFEAYLEKEVWRRNAEHSNAMAKKLYEKVKNLPNLEVVYPVQANGVFAKLPRNVWTKLQEKYFFYDWDLDNDVVRWLCSFDTTDDDIDDFVAELKKLLK